MAIKPPTAATEKQKENFKIKFAEIVNENLIGKYSIHFFDTATKSNYVFNSPNGKSMNILDFLSLEEREEYKKLKSDWQKNKS